MGGAATARFGHLVNPQRVNVLLSRARRLLLIVGDITHFETEVDLTKGPEGAFWPRVCGIVRRSGVVVSSAEIMARAKKAARA